MRRAACLLLALMLAGCSHDSLKAPCQHPFLVATSGCGPLWPLNR